MKVQLFEALSYKEEGHGFDSRWGNLILRGVDLAPNKNE